ncbi:MAG: T9SS type A sorting domain-containing protein, partial [Flavobacteriales bacterium]
LTTDGIATGSLNFQGRDAQGEVWQVRNLTFSSEDAQVFGCTDETANNYNAEATYDNGTCDFSVGIADTGSLEVDIFQIFPNPISGGVIGITFTDAISAKADAELILYDQTGKLIVAQQINAEQLIAGGKFEIRKDLAPGIYTLQLKAEDQVQQHRLVKE